MRKKSRTVFMLTLFLLSGLLICFSRFFPSTGAPAQGRPLLTAAPDPGAWDDVNWTVKTVSFGAGNITDPVNATGTFVDSVMNRTVHNATNAERWLMVEMNETVNWTLTENLTATVYANYTPQVAPYIDPICATINGTANQPFNITENGTMGINITQFATVKGEFLVISYFYQFNFTLTPKEYGQSTLAFDDATKTGNVLFNLFFQIALPKKGNCTLEFGFSPSAAEHLTLWRVYFYPWGGGPFLYTGVTSQLFTYVNFSYTAAPYCHLRYYFNLPYTFQVDTFAGMWYDQTHVTGNVWRRTYHFNFSIATAVYEVSLYLIDGEIASGEPIEIVSHDTPFIMFAYVPRFAFLTRPVPNKVHEVVLEFNPTSRFTLKAKDSNGNLITETVSAKIYYANTTRLVETVSFSDGDAMVVLPAGRYDFILTDPDGKTYRKLYQWLPTRGDKTVIFETAWTPINWTLIIIIIIIVGVTATGVALLFLYYRPASTSTAAWKILRRRK